VNWCALTGADRTFAKNVSRTPHRAGTPPPTQPLLWRPVEAVGLVPHVTQCRATSDGSADALRADVGGTQTRSSADAHCRRTPDHFASPVLQVRRCCLPMLCPASFAARLGAKKNGAIDPSSFCDHSDRKSKPVRPCA
jgi:hypothetical protein